MKNDEFNGPAISGFWTDNDSGAQSVLSGGSLVMPVGPGEQCRLTQEGLVIPLDVWCKITLPDEEFDGTNFNFQMWFDDWNYEDVNWGDLGLVMAWNYGQGADFYVGGWMDSAGGAQYDDDYIATSGVRTSYLRAKVDGVVAKVFYSLSYPKADDDWTEISLSNDPIWTPGTPVDLNISGNPDSVETFSHTIGFVRNWSNRKPIKRTKRARRGRR